MLQIMSIMRNVTTFICQINVLQVYFNNTTIDVVMLGNRNAIGHLPAKPRGNRFNIAGAKQLTH